MSEKALVDNQEYLDVFPLTRGKRALVYFADLFINFLLSLFIFSTIVFPIWGNASGYFSIQNENYSLSCQMLDVLYDNKLLDYDSSNDAKKYDSDSAIAYSSEQFIYSQIKKDSNHNYFYHFYVELLGKSEETYKESFKNLDTKRYFDYTGTLPVLKDSYIEELSPLLDPNDKVSDQGQTDFNNMKNSFVVSLFTSMVNDLTASNDIVSSSDLYKYREYRSLQKENDVKSHNALTYSTYLSFFLASLINFLVIPLCTKRGRTISMIALKVERISIKDYRALRKSDIISTFIYQLVFTMPLMMFTPMLYVSFSSLFDLPLLGVPSLVSLIFPLASLITMWVSKFKRTISDFLFQDIYVDKEILEKIYAAKGYQS